MRCIGFFLGVIGAALCATAVHHTEEVWGFVALCGGAVVFLGGWVVTE